VRTFECGVRQGWGSEAKSTPPPIWDREDLRGSRTPDADLGALDVEPGIEARDDLDPGTSTEIVRENDQLSPRRVAEGTSNPSNPSAKAAAPIACVAS
jgi:hypothetical protein